MSIKKDCWDLDINCLMTYRVVFDEEVSEEEAKNLFRKGDYTDILDTYTLEESIT